MLGQNKASQKFAHIEEQIRRIAQNSEHYPTSSTSKPEEIGAALDNYTAIKLCADWAGVCIGKFVSELLSVGLIILLTEMQTKVKKRDISEIGDIQFLPSF